MTPHLCVKMNIGIRFVEEILKYAEIARGYADRTGSSHGRHASQSVDLTDILEYRATL